MYPNAWEALLHLNSTRNALAHNLQPKDIEAKVKRLTELCDFGDDDDSSLPAEYEAPTEPALVVKECIYKLMGLLHVMKLFIEMLDLLPSWICLLKNLSNGIQNPR